MAFAPVFQRPFAGTFDRHVVGAPPAANWWEAGGAPTPVAVYQPKGAASLAASYVNLANPGTYDAAPGVAPTLTADGWVFAGAQYLTTGITLQTTYSLLVRFSGATQSDDNSIVIGGRTGDYDYGLIPAVANVVHRYVSRSTFVQVVPAVVSGVMGTAGDTCYLDGISEGILTGMGPVSILIGAFLPNFGFFTGNILALSIYSSTLTAGEVAAVSAAMSLL